MKLFFICLLSVLLNVMEIITLSMIHMFEYVFQIKLKKNMNVKVFNLISGVNKTGFLVPHEPCECKCGFNESHSP